MLSRLVSVLLVARHWREIHLGWRRGRLRERPHTQDCVPASLAFLTGRDYASFPLPRATSGRLGQAHWAITYSGDLEAAGLPVGVEFDRDCPTDGEWIGLVPRIGHAVVMRGDTCIYDPEGGFMEGYKPPEFIGSLRLKDRR